MDWASLRATTDLFWRSTLLFVPLDAALLALLVWRIKPAHFRRLKWPLAIVAAAFWSALWTAVLAGAWDWFYSYVFPDWVRQYAPLVGLAYGAVALGMGWLAGRLPGNPVIAYCLLGGLEGLLTHVWAVVVGGIMISPPFLQGVEPVAVLVFAFFEVALYWSVILLLAALLHGLVDRLRHSWRRNALAG
jgi:hypothetical protein